MDNSVAVNDRGLIKVLSSRKVAKETGGRITPGRWRSFLQTSTDGVNFSGYWLSPAADEDVWSPKIAFLSPSSDEFVIVWERHAGGAGGEILGRVHYRDGWGAAFAISPAGAISAEPSLSVYKGNVYAGWQELVDGGWKVKVAKIL